MLFKSITYEGSPCVWQNSCWNEGGREKGQNITVIKPSNATTIPSSTSTSESNNPVSRDSSRDSIQSPNPSTPTEQTSEASLQQPKFKKS